MSYLVYNGKRVISAADGGKYVSKIQISPELINRLTEWNNIDFNTFISSGVDITSAIETNASYGRCRSNTYYIEGGDPDYGTAQFIFYLTVNSGVSPRVQSWRNGVVNGTFGFSYLDPGDYSVPIQILGSGLSGNWAFGFINSDGSNPTNVNFSATNCRMYVDQGDGKPFTP